MTLVFFHLFPPAACFFSSTVNPHFRLLQCQTPLLPAPWLPCPGDTASFAFLSNDPASLSQHRLKIFFYTFRRNLFGYVLSVVSFLFALEETGDFQPCFSLHFLSLPHHRQSHWALHLSPSWLTLSIISYLRIAGRNTSTPLRKPNLPRVSVKTFMALRTGGLGGELGWWKGIDYSPNLHWKSMLPPVRSSHWKGNRKRCLS